MNKKILIASSAVAMALIAAPAFAESDGKGGERFGINLGSIVSELRKERNDDRKEKHDDRKDSATSTVSVRGTVTSINSTILTLSGKDGAVHTVQTANATFENGTLANIAVGDVVKVKGTLSGTVLVATKIEEKENKQREFKAKLESLRAGIVTTVSSGAFTLTRLGTGTTSTIQTNASTTVKVHGKATTTAAIVPGSLAIVIGSSTGTSTPDTLVGNVVHIITKGFGWLKHALLN